MEIRYNPHFLRGCGDEREILDEYLARANDLGPVARRILEKRIVKSPRRGQIFDGGDPFSCVLVGDIIRPQGFRIATLSDIEEITREESNQDLADRGPSGVKDCGILLWTQGNGFIYEDLARQVRERQEMEGPVLLNLSDLALRREDNSPYGMAFDLRYSAKPLDASILQRLDGDRYFRGSFFRSKDVDLETGLPKRLRVGTPERFDVGRQINYNVFPVEGAMRLQPRDGAWGGNFLEVGARYRNLEESNLGVPRFVYSPFAGENKITIVRDVKGV